MQGHLQVAVPALISNKDISKRSFILIMDSYDKKVTKPSDNVITPDQKPSSVFGIFLLLTILGISLWFASLYFGLLNV